MGNSALFIAVFPACAVKAVEAVTIVLAAGIGRGWRSAITGLLTLAMIVAALGPAVSAIPLNTLRLVVGAEGAGAQWPGSDLALFALIPAVGVYALILVALLRRRDRRGEVVCAGTPDGPTGTYA
jgi:uncharacterized membrane protein